jgi:pimeloyl-ACP methyl ester carboxylesterase
MNENYTLSGANSHPSNIYVLIHGAWHAKWCWKYIIPLLEQAGQSVIAIDLPGHGEDKTEFTAITINTYVQAVSQLVKQQTQPVILVGHSFAGMIISQVAENYPELIKKLIYVAAFLPVNGKSMTEEARAFATPGLLPECIVNKKTLTIDLRQSERLQQLFYPCCNAEHVQFALQHLQPEPLRPTLESVHLSKQYFGNVPKKYIKCLQDAVIPLIDQEKMCMRYDCEVVELNADHAPFFSAVKELVGAIVE